MRSRCVEKDPDQNVKRNEEAPCAEKRFQEGHNSSRPLADTRDLASHRSSLVAFSHADTPECRQLPRLAGRIPGPPRKCHRRVAYAPDDPSGAAVAIRPDSRRAAHSCVLKAIGTCGRKCSEHYEYADARGTRNRLRDFCVASPRLPCGSLARGGQPVSPALGERGAAAAPGDAAGVARERWAVSRKPRSAAWAWSRRARCRRTPRRGWSPRSSSPRAARPLRQSELFLPGEQGARSS